MGNFTGSNRWAGQQLNTTQLFVVANTAARVALGNNVPGPTQANIGDIAVQTDTTRWYIMSVKSTPSVDGDWAPITAMSATLVANTPAGAIAGVTVQAAINELDTEKGTRLGIRTSVVGLAGNAALGAGLQTVETLAIAGMPATAVILGFDLSATPIAGAMFGQARNNGAAAVQITYANNTAVAINVAADAAVRVTWIDTATW